MLVIIAEDRISLKDSQQVRVEKTLRNARRLRQRMTNIQYICTFVAAVSEIADLKKGLSAQHAKEQGDTGDPVQWGDDRGIAAEWDHCPRIK